MAITSRDSDLTLDEKKAIKYCINNGNIVFDIGGYHGEWTASVLDLRPECYVHIFEPFNFGLPKIKKSFINDKVFSNTFCISDSLGFSYFWRYEHPPLSTMYKRNAGVIKGLGFFNPPQRVVIIKMSLDEYCKSKNIKYIDFLKIDTEGSEFDILKGASNLLSEKGINYIQFEYGGTYQDSNITLEEIFLYLKGKGYIIGKLATKGVDFICQFSPEMEDYIYCNYLAIIKDKKIFHIQFDAVKDGMQDNDELEKIM